MAGICRFVKRNKEPIEVLVSVLGAVGVVIGLVYTGWQIRLGAKQLEAANLYAMQKDARDLFRETMKVPEFVEYVFKYNSSREYPAEVTDEAASQTGLVLNFYSSIFRQYKLDAISDSAWAFIYNDMCQLFERPAIQKMWIERFERLYTNEFVDVVQSCSDP